MESTNYYKNNFNFNLRLKRAPWVNNQSIKEDGFNNSKNLFLSLVLSLKASHGKDFAKMIS
jgi:hypothetical protein